MRNQILILLMLAGARPAFAGTCILGFCPGDDTMTLSAILSQAMEQVNTLHQLAEFTSDIKNDISFIRDVYETGQDIANQDWDALAQELVGDLLASNADIRTIYSNTQSIISGNVPRSDGFRSLISTGIGQGLFTIFGPYPVGPRGAQYALSDYHSVNLNEMAKQIHDKAKQAQTAARLQANLKSCTQGMANCQESQAHIAVQVHNDLDDLKQLQAEQADAYGTQLAVETSERKQHAYADAQQLNEVVTAIGQMKSNQSNITVGQ
jgi:hypothetical protein